MGTLPHLRRQNPDEKLNNITGLQMEQVANLKKLRADLQGISAYVEVSFYIAYF